MQVFTDDGLHKIATHQYVAGKYTPLDNILNPFWYKLTNFLPLWLAPNLVTLVGLMNCVVGYILLWTYSPTFSEQVPGWVLVACGIFQWNYQTLDAMDGKQARRTGASSPLGQLFDHGCDAACTIYHIAVGCALVTPGPKCAMYGTIALQCGFFIPQWREYHLHVLDTAIGPLGVTEIQHALVFAGVTSGYFGTGYADTAIVSGYEVRHAVILGWVLLCAVASIMLIKATLETVYEKGGSSAVVTASLQLLNIAVIGVVGVQWPEEILGQCPRVVALTTSIVIVHVTNQMIVFAMSQQPYPLFQPLVVLYTVTWAVISYGGFGAQNNYYLMNVVMLIAGLTFFSWTKTAIDQICEKLSIRCFTIVPKENK